MNLKARLKKADNKVASFRAATFAVLSCTAIACAPVGPDFVRPEVPLNPEWLEAEEQQFNVGSAQLIEWWRILEDPVLDQLIETAYTQNNSLKIAGLRVLEAQARLGIATGAKYPQTQVLAGGATAVGASESNANTTAGDLEFTNYNLGANVSWEIDFWGRFRRGIEAADANYLASIANYDDVMVLLTAQVADTYTVIRATEEQLRLANESLKIQRRSYDIAELLYRNGENSELDALQARTLLLGTEAVVPDLRSALRQTKNSLSVLLGMAPGEIDSMLHGEGVLPTVPAEFSIGAPADMLRQRPDVRAAELNALAQNALVGVAEADLYPSFSLNGSLGLAAAGNTDTTRTGDSGIGELFRAESLTYAAGASFVWPFLNYGRIRNNIRVEDARLQQALIAYRETVIQAAGEAENAMAAFVGTQEQDRILSEGVMTASRSAELSLLRYQEGFADYTRVLNAQQSLFTQQQRYATNQGAVIRNLIAIYRSLGGGWTSERQFVDDATSEEMQQRTNWGELLKSSP
jgi:NodT family efflux transporter outer membrane factor (OMF) lipoprotein